MPVMVTIEERPQHIRRRMKVQDALDEPAYPSRNNRAPSSAGRRFWELSGGILFCPCGRRMATHTALRKGEPDFYYVCGLRRSGSRRCEHGARFHRAEEIERKVRALVFGFLSRPEEVRRRAEEYV